MGTEKIVEILTNELACVIRADKGCDRKCQDCDLVRPTAEIVEAYCEAIKIVENTDGNIQ